MKNNLSLPILTLGHFVVDLACLFFFFCNYPQNELISGIAAALLYNFLAFALQAPIGYFFDRFSAKRSTSIGLLLVICGYTCGFFYFSAVGLILCGFGNAFYHIGGSIGIARTDKKGLKDSGIFVSAGALGVSLGSYLSTYEHGLPSSFATGRTVIIFLLLIVLLFLQFFVISSKAVITVQLPQRTNAALLMLSLFAVFIRSLGGLFFPSSYKVLFTFPKNTSLTLFLMAMASGTVAFLGKLLGGFLSNLTATLLHKFTSFKNSDSRSGNYLFGTVTLLLSAILLTFGDNLPVLCFLGILCFHSAMPVTLFELYCIFPERPGFAMGLSTVMLFLGYLPYAFVSLDSLSSTPILLLLTLLATGCMIVSLWIYRKTVQK